MKNLFQQIKSSIDYAIFCAEPPSWEKDYFEWKRKNPISLCTELFSCQDKINGLANNRFDDKVDPRSKAKLEELKRKVKTKITTLEKKIESVKGSKKDLKKRISELKAALVEIQVIEKSNTHYLFNVNAKEPKFNYDELSNTGTVQYDGSLGSLLNELKHAFQYETGRIDFIKINTGSGKV